MFLLNEPWTNCQAQAKATAFPLTPYILHGHFILDIYWKLEMTLLTFSHFLRGTAQGNVQRTNVPFKVGPFSQHPLVDWILPHLMNELIKFLS